MSGALPILVPCCFSRNRNVPDIRLEITAAYAFTILQVSDSLLQGCLGKHEEEDITRVEIGDYSPGTHEMGDEMCTCRYRWDLLVLHYHKIMVI